LQLWAISMDGTRLVLEFQSPSGDSRVATGHSAVCVDCQTADVVSVPWRGFEGCNIHDGQRAHWPAERWFQSPSGDSRVATSTASGSALRQSWSTFQSPSGDSRVATTRIGTMQSPSSRVFQSPSGDSRVATLYLPERSPVPEFQSPSGDSRVATSSFGRTKTAR